MADFLKMKRALEAMERCFIFAAGGKCADCPYANEIRRVGKEEIHFLNEMLERTSYESADPDTVKLARKMKGNGLGDAQICTELNITERTLRRMLRVKPPFCKVFPRKVKKFKVKRRVNDG